MCYALHQTRCILPVKTPNTSELMHLHELMTDAAVLAELGRRLARHRIERNWTQAELAAEAGVGQATVQRAERGESVQMTSMIDRKSTRLNSSHLGNSYAVFFLEKKTIHKHDDKTAREKRRQSILTR